MKKNLNFTLWFCLFGFIFYILCYAQEAPQLIAPGAMQKEQKLNPVAGRISLDIKGMDIVDVLKMLATRVGLNIAIGKNVSGRVTTFLKDVDAWGAFEMVLLANDLAYEQKGEIINVMTQRDYELIYGERFKDIKRMETMHLKYAKATELAKSLNQIKTNIGRIAVDEASNTVVLIDAPEAITEMLEFIKQTDVPLITRIFTLNYAPADKLQAKLQETVTKGSGSIKIDERTNKITVTDYPEKLEEISKLIAAFDEKPLQVLIDAQIIELTPSDAFKMGVDWDYWAKKYLDIKLALPQSATGALIMGTASTNPAKANDYKGIMDILRTIGDTKILSSPRILVVNNQEAKILVGTKDAYITSTTSQGGSGNTVTSQSVSFVDTGIKLYVTPTINKDGFITMRIKPEVSSSKRTDITAEGKITQIPIVTTSEAESTLMVKDGVTIIMGGLKKDKRDKTVKKIPFLGDIPGLGFLLRSTTDEYTKTELVILLTPHIVSGEESFTDFSEIPPKDGGVAKMVKGNIIIEKIAQAKSTLDNLEYKRLVLDKIRALALFDRPKNEKGEIKLFFSLGADGRLQGEPKVTSSSNPNLNAIAIKHIKSASPFPAFPSGAKEPENFTIAFDYK